jgi:hypothetical protein
MYAPGHIIFGKTTRHRTVMRKSIGRTHAGKSKPRVMARLEVLSPASISRRIASRVAKSRQKNNCKTCLATTQMPSDVRNGRADILGRGRQRLASRRQPRRPRRLCVTRAGEAHHSPPPRPIATTE